MKTGLLTGALLIWPVSCSLLTQGDGTCSTDDDCSSGQCDDQLGVCILDASLGGLGGGANLGTRGGDDPAEDGCSRDPVGGPPVEISGDITEDFLLTCDLNYVLVGKVLVRPGAELSVEAGTTIYGDKQSTGTLVVQPGASLNAVGRPNAPIVFTSQAEPGFRSPGDWGGVILLGDAPTNHTDEDGVSVRGRVEGIVEGGEYGGSDASDSSGILRFVRIEYSGATLGPNNEINGLTMAGVGNGTVIDHVQVRRTQDDCFEFFGGTVNASHLICQANGDDGFDWDNGYRGHLQFLVLQQDQDTETEAHGFEGDNNPTGTTETPLSRPTISNATLCGKSITSASLESYGILLKNATEAEILNTLVVGFEAGLDIQDANTSASISNSVFWENTVRPIAYDEDDSGGERRKDDDNGLDEVALVLAGNNLVDPEATTDVGRALEPLRRCGDSSSFNMRPTRALTANAAAPPPPLDEEANYVGAFEDDMDDWAEGRWTVWSAQ